MRLLLVKVVPLLVFGVINRHCLSLSFKPLPEDAGGVDLRVLEAAVVRKCQWPILHGIERAPNTMQSETVPWLCDLQDSLYYLHASLEQPLGILPSMSADSPNCADSGPESRQHCEQAIAWSRPTGRHGPA